MKTYVIGDIHGNYKGLMQCLQRSGFDYDNDKLVSLGDIADGWPEVPQCVEELLKIKNLISIRGNHDDWAYEWMKSGNFRSMWLAQGGKATKDAYEKYGSIPETHIQFFKNQINYYIDDQNRGFVHGGFNSKHGLGHETYQSDYYWDRDLWQLALLQDRAEHDTAVTHATRFYKHLEIYIGHTTTLNWSAKGNTRESKDPNQKLNGPITVPMKRCNVWNLDTGGGYNGKVTIMDIETKEYWQSDISTELYPDHQMR